MVTMLCDVFIHKKNFFFRKVTEEYLRGYFEHASGPVSNVSFVQKLENNKKIRVAHVTFVLPDDAARYEFNL